MKISVVINTYNADKYLAEVLESVKRFDEIVICDMESTDNTLSIAKKYNCKIVTFPKEGHTYVEPARNFAIHQASHPWVLVVDADELVTDALREYLYKFINDDNGYSGIVLARRNFFMKKFMRCSYPDHILRFFKKEGAVWPTHIHSRPAIQGKLYTMPGRKKELAFIHLLDDTVEVITNKTNNYTRYELDKRRHKNYGVLALFHRPFIRFFKAYIIKGGFRDGISGFICCSLIGYYQFIMVAKMIEERQRKKNELKYKR